MEINTKAYLWMVLPFFLVPFCAFPVPILGTLMLQDLGRIIFIPLGLLYILNVNVSTVSRVQKFVLIALYFLFFNLIALYFSGTYYNSNPVIISLKFIVWYTVLLAIPLLGVMSFQERVPQNVFKKIYLIQLFIVFFVTCFQIPTLLRIDNFITNLYTEHLFRFIEGTWSSIPRLESNSITEFRNLGTFSEPSVLSSFILIYCFPYQISSFVNGEYVFSKYRDLLAIVGSMITLVFSISSIAFAMLSINLVLFVLLIIKKNFSLEKILYLLIFVVPIVYAVFEFNDIYVKFISRIFRANNVSSQTRYGSIIAAIKLFYYNPFGVGFSREKELLYSYIPTWGRTIETFYQKSYVQSTFLKYLSMFGLSWMFFCVYGVVNFIKKFYSSRVITIREREQILIWVFNFSLLMTLHFLEFTLVFFLVSAVFTFSPLFRSVEVNS